VKPTTTSSACALVFRSDWFCELCIHFFRSFWLTRVDRHELTATSLGLRGHFFVSKSLLPYVRQYFRLWATAAALDGQTLYLVVWHVFPLTYYDKAGAGVARARRDVGMSLFARSPHNHALNPCK